MEDIFECDVCFERYNSTERRPKILPCGHTFCLQCLLTHEKSCSKCRLPFKQDPDKLSDNYTLLSATGTPSKRFWCQDCNADATTLCEDEHNICSKKKILLEKTKEAQAEMNSQLSTEMKILDEIINKLSPIQLAFKDSLNTSVSHEVNGHAVSKELISDAIESISGSLKKPHDDTLNQIKIQTLKSLDRLPLLKEKHNLLKLVEKCKVSITPDGAKVSWDLHVDVNADGVSDEEKGLFYLLYVLLGRENLVPSDMPKQQAAGDTAACTCTSALKHAPSLTPNGKCIIQISVNGQHQGQLSIELVEKLNDEKKKAIQEGLDGVKLFPKNGMLTGSMCTDAFLKGNGFPIEQGSVTVARSPLHPLHIFVRSPGSAKPKADMHVLGKIMEDLEFLSLLLENSSKEKQFATISNAVWA